VIQRIEYLSRLAKWREKPPVKAVSGIRGCGKTTLLAQYIDWLKHTGVQDTQIIYINLEEPEIESLFNYQGLYGYIKKRLASAGGSGNLFTYVFIDELQRCENYEKAIEGLLIKKQADLYVTVSNGRFFSAVPFVEIRVLPLSFTEYLAITKVRLKTSPLKTQKTLKAERRLPRQKERMEKFLLKEAFNEYLSFGGFPFAAALGGDSALVRQCVEGIYNTILVKDAARQPGINDIPLLELVARMISGSTSHPVSSKKFSTAINAKGRKISTNTVETYIQALSSAYVFYHAVRFDIKTGKQLKTLGKYYAMDTGLRNLLLEQEPQETCSQLENIVCLELLRRGFQVYIGKNGSDEINFFVFHNPSVYGAPAGTPAAYFQVAARIRDKDVLASKLSPLERIRDNHPKYILSLDETPFRSNYNGIMQRNLIDWLLEPKR